MDEDARPGPSNRQGQGSNRHRNRQGRAPPARGPAAQWAGVDGGGDGDDGVEGSGGRGGGGGGGGQNVKHFFASQFMQPEWMTDVPPDLGRSW